MEFQHIGIIFQKTRISIEFSFMKDDYDGGEDSDGDRTLSDINENRFVFSIPTMTQKS